MFYFFTYIISILILNLILFVITSMISEMFFFSGWKQLPFDCGFSSIKTIRSPFSLQFFLIGLIFVIFDVEIVIFLTFLFFSSYWSLLEFLYLSGFILFLFLGLWLEWKSSKLIWFK